MYEEYFGLRESPFDLSTDPRFLYMSPAHARARAYLDYAVYKGDGLVVITGEIGVGKSTLIHEIASREHEHAQVVVIQQPRPGIVEFLQALLLHWGREQPPQTKPELIAAVHDEIAESFMWGKRTTLIVDEAQTIEREALEELRMLADRQIGAEKPLAIVLVGQPCLRARLAGDDLEQFRQRVRLSYHLAALDEQETSRYVEKRLEIAGASPGPWPIFREDTMTRIHRYTGGIPRLVNVLADLSLTSAYLDGADSVTLAQVDSAIEELGWVPYARRRRSAKLAMPGIGLTSRLRAQLDSTSRTARRFAAGGWVRSARGVAQLRERLVVLTRSSAQWLRGAVQRMPRTLRSLPVAAADAGTRLVRPLRALPALARQRVGDRSWVAANAVRALGIVFIGGLIATVVISGNRSDPERPAVELAATPIASDLPAATDDARPALRETPASAAPDAFAWVPKPLAQSSRVRAAAAAVPAMTLSAAGPPVEDDAPVKPAPVSTPEPDDQPADGQFAPGLEGENWLLAQAPDTYVIQVLAARNRDVLERFLSSNAGGMELAYYRRMRDDTEWHVLVSGMYSSYPSAQQARAALPAAVRKTGPWIRPTSKVQEDIREASGQLQARAML